MPTGVRHNYAEAADKISKHPDPTLGLPEMQRITGICRSVIYKRIVGKVGVEGYFTPDYGRPYPYYDRDSVVLALRGQS